MTEAEELELLELEELEAKTNAAKRAQAAPEQPQSGERYNDAASFAVGTARGATADFLDELAGAYGKLAPTWAGGLGDRIQLGAAATPQMKAEEARRPSNYQLVRDRVREDFKAREEEDKKLTLGGQVFGGFALPVPGGSAAQGAKLLSRVGRSAAQGAAMGGAYGLGASEADLTRGNVGNIADAGLDTLRGAAFGGVAGAAGQGLASAIGSGASRLSRTASKRVKAATEKAKEIATKETDEATAGARSKLGGDTSSANRTLDVLAKILDDPGATQSEKAAAREFLESEAGRELISGVYQGHIERAGDQLSRVRSSRDAYTQLVGGRDKAILERTKELTSPGEALSQVKERAVRYLPPVLGDMMGSLTGDALVNATGRGVVGLGAGYLLGGDATSAGLGALAGAGLRPGMHALRRMYQHPSFQTQLFGPITGGSKAAASAASRAGGRVGRAAGSTASWWPDELVPILSDDSDEEQRKRILAEALLDGR